MPAGCPSRPLRPRDHVCPASRGAAECSTMRLGFPHVPRACAQQHYCWLRILGGPSRVRMQCGRCLEQRRDRLAHGSPSWRCGRRRRARLRVTPRSPCISHGAHPPAWRPVSRARWRVPPDGWLPLTCTNPTLAIRTASQFLRSLGPLRRARVHSPSGCSGRGTCLMFSLSRCPARVFREWQGKDVEESTDRLLLLCAVGVRSWTWSISPVRCRAWRPSPLPRPRPRGH